VDLVSIPGAAASLQRLSLSQPTGLAVDRTSGAVFVADTGNNRIVRIDDPTGPNPIFTRVAGTGASGPPAIPGMPARDAAFNHPSGVVVDGSGNLYIADTLYNSIRMVTPGPDGTVNGGPGEIITTVAGTLVPGCTGDGLLARIAQLNQPKGIDVDAFDNLYIADSGCNGVRRIDAGTGLITTVARGLSNPSDVQAFNGDLFVADTGHNTVCQVRGGVCVPVAGNGRPGFIDNVPALQASLTSPRGLTVGFAGGMFGLFIADTVNQRIRKVTREGFIMTIAGGGSIGQGDCTGEGVPAILARLSGPSDVVVDLQSNLFIADTNCNRIRWVDASGIIRTVGP
jgi:hypothetical protein